MNSKLNLVRILSAFTVAVLSVFVSSVASARETSTFTSRLDKVRESFKSQSSENIDSQLVVNSPDDLDQLIKQRWCNSNWCNV
jgi:hypothetical protein